MLSKAVLQGCHFALHDMSNAIKRSVTSTYLNVPEPFIASDNVAASMYPWRAFISKYVYKSYNVNNNPASLAVFFFGCSNTVDGVTDGQVFGPKGPFVFKFYFK